MQNDDPDFVPDKLHGKACARCGKFKPFTEYFKRGKNSSNYHAYCKACHSDPFKYERIICPHCAAKICFFGIDPDGAVIRTKSNIIAQLRKDIKRELKLKKAKRVVTTTDSSAPVEPDLRDLFKNKGDTK